MNDTKIGNLVGPWTDEIKHVVKLLHGLRIPVEKRATLPWRRVVGGYEAKLSNGVMIFVPRGEWTDQDLDVTGLSEVAPGEYELRCDAGDCAPAGATNDPASGS